MWVTASRSEFIQRFCGIQYGLAPQLAGASLHTSLAYKVDLSTEHVLKLCGHSIHIEQGNAGTFLETHQNINVTLRSKILPERGPEYGQAHNSVCPAKGFDPICWDV